MVFQAQWLNLDKDSSLEKGDSRELLVANTQKLGDGTNMKKIWARQQQRPQP